MEFELGIKHLLKGFKEEIEKQPDPVASKLVVSVMEKHEMLIASRVWSKALPDHLVSNSPTAG